MSEMVKTSVYLSPQDAAALRRVSEQTGRSQAELIREAVASIVATAPKRRFHSRGLGTGPAYSPPDPDAIEARLRNR